MSNIYLLLQFCTDYNQTWINMIWAGAAKTLLSQIFHKWRRIEVNCVYISHCKWYRTSAGMPACIPNRRYCAGQCAGQWFLARLFHVPRQDNWWMNFAAHLRWLVYFPEMKSCSLSRVPASKHISITIRGSHVANFGHTAWYRHSTLTAPETLHGAYWDSARRKGASKHYDTQQTKRFNLLMW